MIFFRVLKSIDKRGEKKCKAKEGIIREPGSIIVETKKGTRARDKVLIIAVKKVKFYGKTTCAGMLQLPITMDQYDATELLVAILIGQEVTDLLLTVIAENNINLATGCERNGQIIL